MTVVGSNRQLIKKIANRSKRYAKKASKYYARCHKKNLDYLHHPDQNQRGQRDQHRSTFHLTIHLSNTASFTAPLGEAMVPGRGNEIRFDIPFTNGENGQCSGNNPPGSAEPANQILVLFHCPNPFAIRKKKACQVGPYFLPMYDKANLDVLPLAGYNHRREKQHDCLNCATPMTRMNIGSGGSACGDITNLHRSHGNAIADEVMSSLTLSLD
ncbi:MAG: hypothetical protein V4632_13990 [Pseudomonadota bacterium]